MKDNSADTTAELAGTYWKLVEHDTLHLNSKNGYPRQIRSGIYEMILLR